MALTQEEIRIRAGLDYSKVTAGLNGIRSQVGKLAADIPNRLRGILATNVFMASAQMIEPLKQQFFSLFDLGDEAVKKYEAQAASVADATRELISQNEKLKKSRDDLNKGIRDAFFEEGSNLDKQAILESELETQREIARVEGERVKRLKAAGAPSGEAQQKANAALIEQLKIEKELNKVREKFDPEEAALDFQRRDKALSDQAIAARQRFRSIKEESEMAAEVGDFDLMSQLLSEAESERKKIGGIVSERNRISASDPFIGPRLPTARLSFDTSLGRQSQSMQNSKDLEDALKSFAGTGVFKVFIKGVED